MAGRSDIFERIAPYIRDTVTLTGDGEPDQVIAVRSLGLFPVLGIPARLGRTLIASDDEGPRNVAVLSDRLWRRRYHADPGVIGRGSPSPTRLTRLWALCREILRSVIPKLSCGHPCV